MTAEGNRRDAARILLPEVQFNDRRAQMFGNIHQQVASGQQLRDVKGNVIPLDWSKGEILPGSFSFSVFDSTVSIQAHLDADLLDSLHGFYRLLRQAEHFREAAAKDDAPQRRGGFLKDVFESAFDAVEVAHGRRLTERLKEASK